MAVSPKAASRAVHSQPKSDHNVGGGGGGTNHLSILLAAAASMHCQQQNSPKPSSMPDQHEQQQFKSLKNSAFSPSSASKSTSMLRQKQQKQQQLQHLANGFTESNNNPAAAELLIKLVSGTFNANGTTIPSTPNQNSDPISSSPLANSTNTSINDTVSLKQSATQSKPATTSISTSTQKHQNSKQSTATTKNNNNNNLMILTTVNKQTVNNKQQTVNNKDGPEHIELRSLERWHDEDEQPTDCYQELVDQFTNSSNGWSADEMFKYNEKMHKIASSYNERTLSKNYTTPLPKINSKSTMKLATQLAKEIQDRVIAEGRITPESSDDDELFESQKLHRKANLKRQKQLDQLRSLSERFNGAPANGILPLNSNNISCVSGKGSNKTTTTTVTTKSSSQYSNSTETPATISLSSSPTLNDIIIKPVTSSSRNILRTCLT